ncbi:helix-turn-helix transcriptional regulator [Nocardiopsis metallicus]|uniref:Putative DNA-binding transcriptional regulator YafY n=1 Tax=Nocardiopsis metallicus TaxID=179819 RepID=A0A840WJ09_9ACTN|nr:YafY family protein [Nocardiopsis metallicus]MBB5490058.1 putative DNA-binding transcriptional regulator YafY [Nocardiopsis metallicus]
MADTSQRMLRLLSLLQNGRAWSGAELTEALGTSPRSMRRDIDRLRELGYPVESLRGPGGHYRLVAGKALPPLMFEDDEVVTVALGLRMVAGGLSGVQGAEDGAERALGKIERVLPSHLSRRASTLASAVDPGRRVWPGASSEVLTGLGEAVAAGQWVRMTHRGRDGQERHRRVDPYRLLLLGRRWYLFAWDRDRADWRSFRLDRITGLTPTRAAFTPRELPAEDLAAYLEQGFGTGGRGRGEQRLTVRVLFHASAAEVAARIVRVDGSLEAVGAHKSRYTARVDSYEWIAIVLAMTGLDFTVEGPEGFRDYATRLSARLGRAVGAFIPPSG